MEILNRREQIKAAAIPPEIANPTTLVTTSDKATKSKAGIVKIGDGINVANGVISVPAGGLTYDVLWEGDILPDGQTKPIELTHSLDDYKFIIACQVRGSQVGSPASMLPVEYMTQQNFYPIFVYAYSTGPVALDSFLFAKYTSGDYNYAINKPEGDTAIFGAKLIGIK